MPNLIQELKSNTFKEAIAEGITLVDFWAPWCGPCKMQTPILEELAGEMSDAKICKVDVDSEPDLARQFGVMSIPTLMVMKNGEVTFKQPGLRQKRDLLELLK